mmetsp:Transcript_6871/g.19381  ORF Transcript_6871/g.19381 Transcript_6871/m.19381 type:complete len:96 (+) Transcript_6871:455-742(+)
MNRITALSNNEKDFIKQAIRRDIRLDGRKPYDYRAVDIQFSKDDSTATIQLGNTRAMAVMSAEIAEPYPDRPSEGRHLALLLLLPPSCAGAFLPE